MPERYEQMMGQTKIPQQHKIMRQVLEVRGCPQDATQRIQSEMRGAYYQRLLPLIEKICSEQSTPGRVHRIDRLEIDLGGVPLDALESAVADKFEAAFSQGLAAVIGDTPETDAELELFDYFIRTGSVPWWANRSEANLLGENLAGLIRRAPRALRRALRAAPDQERMRRRIARAYPDHLLDELAGVLAPSLFAAASGAGSAWPVLLESVSGAHGHAAHATRSLWWEEVLRAADTAENTPTSEAPRFFRAILTRLARRLGLDYRVLITELYRALDDRPLPVLPRVGELIQDILREHGGDSLTRQTAPSRMPSPRSGADIKPVDADLEQIASKQDKDSPHDLMFQEPTVDRQQKDTHNNLTFSDTDSLYVGNAGLVILWPFLENFFKCLGLVEDRQFKDEASVQRGVGLLQYLAGADESPPETLLPLNKVLCGMAPEEVFDFGPALTVQEIEECDDLLTAVIQQAPILHEMSSAGFRGSFLLRQGQLSTRDGNWLLRVERETHDIVLDRFPWGVSIVRLPWMTAMMQVDW